MKKGLENKIKSAHLYKGSDYDGKKACFLSATEEERDSPVAFTIRGIYPSRFSGRARR